MASFQQCLSHWPIANASDDDFKALYEMGFRGIELAPRNTWDKFRDMGFTIVTTGGHGPLTVGLNHMEQHAQALDAIRGNLELAQEYEILHLIVFSGNRDGISEEEGAANCIQALAEIAPEAEMAGVTLIMELLNSKVDHPDYQCDHTAWGVEVVGAVNSPNVKLLYDIYHMQIMEGDLIRTIHKNIEHIGHFHTAGNPRRSDLDENQEIFYPGIARAINNLGFSGWVGHEFSPRKPVLEALQEAYNAFDV